jgi:hypothetical protein
MRSSRLIPSSFPSEHRVNTACAFATSVTRLTRLSRRHSPVSGASPRPIRDSDITARAILVSATGNRAVVNHAVRAS